MLDTIYVWERTLYTREDTADRWKEDETETLYITPDWFMAKTTGHEVMFWLSISESLEIEHFNDGSLSWDCVAPGGTMRSFEHFEPISLSSAICNAGYRELAALEAAEAHTGGLVYELMPGSGHVLITFGDDTDTAMLDLTANVWVN